MSDLDQVLRLWRRIADSDEDCVVATVVRVEGSSYRKPGARMLVTKSGQRAGTISGGCLEAEVSKQAWWLTERGPVVKAYSTSFEMDSDRPYGLGCGGTVHLLLERRANAEVFLQQLHTAWEARLPLACAVTLSGPDVGDRSAVGMHQDAADGELTGSAWEAYRSGRSMLMVLPDGCEVFAEFLAPRCGLFVFGAGDDAKPLVTQARTMGWHITVADGRSNLATRARFPDADEVRVLVDAAGEAAAGLRFTDAAVVMTHSYEQDLAILQVLLAQSMAYLGVLGPRYRTADLMRDAAEKYGGAEPRMKVHSPVGLDLGGDGPAAVALSILAEIQVTISKGSQRPEHAGQAAANAPGKMRAIASLSTSLT